MPVHDVLVLAAGASFLVAVAAALIGYFVVVRPFDRIVGAHEPYAERLFPVYGELYRFTKYGVAILFPNHVKRSEAATHAFSSLDFNGQATASQKLVVVVYGGALVLTVALGCLFILTQPSVV